MAIWPIGRAEVLEAKIQWSEVTASTSASTLCLRSRSSNTASITMSVWSNPWVDGERDVVCVCVRGVGEGEGEGGWGAEVR